MAVYNATTARCAAVVKAMASDFPENTKFLRETRDHEFIFGKEVGAFIDQIWKQGNKLNTLQALTPRQRERETEIIDSVSAHSYQRPAKSFQSTWTSRTITNPGGAANELVSRKW